MAILTRDADKILCIAYKQYLERTKSMNKNDALVISADFFKNEKSTKDWSKKDVFSNLKELERVGYCKVFMDGSFKLKSEAIIHMEQRFKNGFNDVVDFITKFL